MLFDLLDAEANTGITLTENFAMYPTAAVSGFYFAHPEAQYFGVARIGRDQLEDYAQRRGYKAYRKQQRRQRGEGGPTHAPPRAPSAVRTPPAAARA